MLCVPNRFAIRAVAGLSVIAVAAIGAAGCATYVVPAASGDLFAAPFRNLAPVAPSDAVIAARTQRGIAGTSRAARAPRGTSWPLQKVALPDLASTTTVAPSLSPLPSLAPTEPAPAAGCTDAALVEGALRLRGTRFGTDGQVASLYTYMRREQALVPTRAARPGDVLFFAIASGGCADHTGVVEAVDDIGRITFREVRAGQVRTSYVHPGDPTLRRWSDGRVVNSFLRPRRTDDPPAARYFAGEMLCAVGRVRR